MGFENMQVFAAGEEFPRMDFLRSTRNFSVLRGSRPAAALKLQLLRIANEITTITVIYIDRFKRAEATHKNKKGMGIHRSSISRNAP